MLNRRDVVAAPSALAVMAVPAGVEASLADVGLPTAIRERIAKVVETYRVPTFAYPEPMSADEAAAALALTDADFERLEPLLVFAQRWGVCLDWLVQGDVSGLLPDGRHSREREGRVGGSEDA
ncbi:MAG: hypothetical protein AAGG47_11825 [Pseudomonadota bacterium]